MKTKIIFDLIIFSTNTLFCQNYTNLDSLISAIHTDTIFLYMPENKTCNERGHIMGNICSKTLMYCQPYYEDYVDSTIMIYPACNYITFICNRCREEITQLEPEKREVIWIRNKK